MQLYELIFTILIIYLLYKLVFNVVVPVSKVSSAMRARMRQMQEDQVTQQPRNSSYPSSTPKKSGAASTDSEYIDFEEVK